MDRAASLAVMGMSSSDERHILLIGGRGMLGRAWRHLLERRGLPFDAPGRAELDLLVPESIDAAIGSRTKWVINCAGWTDVDGAEQDEEAATQLNGAAVGLVARRCQDVGATLVHYSTDYVFNGRAQTPYRVDAPRDPLNAYGRSKAVGEQLIEQVGGKHLIIRSSWLYGPWGKNFVRTMARLTREKAVLRVVNDQRGRPTSCEHLAAASLALLNQQAVGVYHVTDGGECTWHELTCHIARRLNAACDVQPCTSAEFARPARRPAYSVLDLAETEALLGPMPPWPDQVDDTLDRLEVDTPPSAPRRDATGSAADNR